MPTIDAPITACPKCSGDIWDNRGNLKTPKSPHFKCKNPDCGEAYWLDKPKAAKTPVATVKAPVAAPSTGPVNWAQVQRDYTAVIYTAAHALAKGLGCAVTDLDQQAVQAGAATLMIQLERQGHRLGTLAPKKPKPPTKEELSEPPAALQDDSDVPF